MQGSTLQARTARAVFILVIIGICFVAGQYTTHWLFTSDHNSAERCDIVMTHKTFTDVKEMTGSKFYREAYYDGTLKEIRGEAGVGDLNGPLTVTTAGQPETCGWLLNFNGTTTVRIGGYALGVLALAATSILLWILYEILRWIWLGRRPYVDPCKDLKCPCQRHVVERERAERTQATVVGAAVGVAAASITSGGS